MNMKWVAIPTVAVLVVGTVYGAPCTQVRPYEARLGIVSSPVMVVGKITPGSVAERAGLRSGDVIISSNGQNGRSVVTFRDMFAKVREHALWQVSDLTVIGMDGLKRHVMLRLNTPDDKFGFVAASFGFYVEGVRAGSLGEKAGMKPGEFIYKVSGQEAGSMQGVGDMDLAIQQAVDSGKLSMTLAVLANAEGDTTVWTTRQTTVMTSGPLDGPVPPPAHTPEIIKR